MAIHFLVYLLIAIQIIKVTGIDFVSGFESLISILKLCSSYCVYCLFLEMKYNKNVDSYLIIGDC